MLSNSIVFLHTDLRHLLLNIRVVRMFGEIWRMHQMTGWTRRIATANWFPLGGPKWLMIPASGIWLPMMPVLGFCSIRLRIFKLFICTLIQLLVLTNLKKWQKMMATNYSFGIERDEEALKRNNFDHTKWSNPLEHRCVLFQVQVVIWSSFDILTRLPIAPSMKLYCVYGHGKETEVRVIWRR